MSITTADNSDTSSSPEVGDAQGVLQAHQAQPPKRSSRRANTAERRATHNAVERARRETLNGRFLDLAAMLPNLANVRRPSKSAIVNSSIALIQSQRRNRIVAAREARLLKAENDGLRQELNEWRQRANLPRVEEPARSADLLALLNLNEEDEAVDPRNEFDGNYNLDDAEEYADDVDEEQQQSPESYAPYTVPGPLSVTIPVTHTQHQLHAHIQQQQQQQQLQAQAQAQANAIAQQKAAMIRASQAHAQHQLSVPRIASTQQSLMYGADALFSDAFTLPTPVDNANMFGGNWTQPQQKAPQMITPPSSAHGMGATKQSPFATTANQAFLTGYQAHNGNLGLNMFHSGPGSTLDDDNLSVGSGSSHHESNTSHFSTGSPDMLMGTSPVDHTFAYAPPAQTTNAYSIQGRRASLNIPAAASYLQQPNTSPSQAQVQVPYLMI